MTHAASRGVGPRQECCTVSKCYHDWQTEPKSDLIQEEIFRKARSLSKTVVLAARHTRVDGSSLRALSDRTEHDRPQEDRKRRRDRRRTPIFIANGGNRIRTQRIH